MVVEDTYLIPYLQINQVSVKPFLNDYNRLCFDVPDEASEYIKEFYSGDPQVSLIEYVSKLKHIRNLLFSLRGTEKERRIYDNKSRKSNPPE